MANKKSKTKAGVLAKPYFARMTLTAVSSSGVRV
jgi:hypothetical protein